jgi:putative membrane protein
MLTFHDLSPSGFLFVLNALLIMLAGSIVPGFMVAGFWWALLFSIVLSLISAVFHMMGAEPVRD